MGALVKTLGSLFSNKPQRIARRDQILAQAEAKETTKLAQDRQVQEQQNQQQEQDAEIARARRAPRGRRLLIAATGEEGVQKTTVG